MNRLPQDLRYAVRMLVRQPTFTVTAILTLGLGVGANAAIFSVCHAVLFKPLPYPQPERLVMVWEHVRTDGRLAGVAPANFVDWRSASSSFERVAALNPFRELTLTGAGEPERLAAAAVSAEFFPLLGVPVVIGRNFTSTEDQPGHDAVAIISWGLWQRVFARDPSVIGRSIALNQSPFTIVGVLPPDFALVGKASDFNGQSEFDVWVPLALNHQRLQRGTHPLRVFGRIRPGTTVHNVQAELDVIANALERAHPENKARGIQVTLLSEHVTTGMRSQLLTFLAGVTFVWLLACVNVANLLLTRAAGRQQEMAVRVALGAHGFRLLQQLVTESLLLTSLAALVGVGLAWALLKVLLLQLPFDLPRVEEIGLNGAVLAFITSMSLVTAVAFGCAPLVHTRSVSESARTARYTLSRAGMYTRYGLFVIQIALACVLLIGAGLMGRSLWKLMRVEPGFQADRVLTAQVSLTPGRYPDVRRIASFQREVINRLNTPAGIEVAGIGGYLPLGGSDNSWAPNIEGRPAVSPGDQIQYRPITPGYLEALAIPLLQGRRFSDTDDQDAPSVVIVNETAARKYWPGASPLGRRLQIDGPPWRTVAGIVGDVRHTGLDRDVKPELYLPFAQVPYPSTTMVLVVRAASNQRNLALMVRRVVSEIDPALPLTHVRTMEEVIASSAGERRFRAVLFGAFAVLALMLAAIGVYGVLSYLVTQRMREFGVRLALGATRRDVVRLVLRQSTLLSVIGLALGLLGGIALAQVARNLLFGVSAHDLPTLIPASALLVTFALLASYLPARRAARIDPMQALRAE